LQKPAALVWLLVSFFCKRSRVKKAVLQEFLVSVHGSKWSFYGDFYTVDSQKTQILSENLAFLYDYASKNSCKTAFLTRERLRIFYASIWNVRKS
jgi:hypothetical protein